MKKEMKKEMKKDIKKITKRMIAIILTLFTLLSYASPIFAVSGTGTWVGAQYASYLKTSSNHGSEGILIRRLRNINTTETHTVFCAENHVPFDHSTPYPGEYFNPSDPESKAACKVAYFRVV